MPDAVGVNFKKMTLFATKSSKQGFPIRPDFGHEPGIPKTVLSPVGATSM